MPRAAFTTLGCKVNQYETQKILESFQAAGFQIVPFQEAAEVYVVNTCSVTSQAEAKSRNIIRRAARQSPGAALLVTGCAAQMRLNRADDRLTDEIIVPNPEKLQALSHLAEARPDLLAAAQADPSHAAAPPGRTRATLKIQDGCDVMCSYCSIPYTRPVMTSRPADEVLAEARLLAEQGCREAVLTGVLIGAYGPETGSGGTGFEDLVRRLARESGLARLRISSIEMHQLTDSILELAADGSVAPHFHIPLQCGDSQVLRDMNRRYDADQYLARIEEIRRALPNACITTDILVGFPTETEERFENSLATARAARFLGAHVFRFSPRWGTPADAWGDPVSPAEKQARAARLSEAAAETGLAERQRFIGSLARVIVERPKKDAPLEGLSDQGFTVRFNGPAELARTVQWVRLEEERGGALWGEWAGSERPAGLPTSLA
jgi:threonylcarbamoyladenosine tRNA methylthiotransferase MtaB